jgi:hypothetical protein
MNEKHNDNGQPIVELSKNDGQRADITIHGLSPCPARAPVPSRGRGGHGERRTA